jgi:glycosyltransferase involved in cell wall biosynthesis
MVYTYKLLTIGHSYVVSQNRQLANEISRLGQDRWQVSVVVPRFMKTDLRRLLLEPAPNDLYQLEPLSVYFSQPIHAMFYHWRLKEILSQGWDMVHCWEEPYIVAGAQVAYFTPKHTPLVYRTAQSYSKTYPFPFNCLENYSMTRATGWICSGNKVAEALQQRKGYDLPMRLIPLGVDLNTFYPNPKARDRIRRLLSWDTSGTPVIGYLGRFVPAKGLDLLMRVLDRLTIPWRALFVGTGAMEPQLRKWGERYPGRVQICTQVRHAEASHYLNAMDVLCAPSQTMSHWREQFGRMLIEALACGVPVIGSDSGEIPYVLADAGQVVGEKDEHEWVRTLNNLLVSHELQQEYIQRGLERVHLNYAWPVVAKQYLQFFEEQLSHKGERSRGC